jgi:integrase
MNHLATRIRSESCIAEGASSLGAKCSRRRIGRSLLLTHTEALLSVAIIGGALAIPNISRYRRSRSAAPSGDSDRGASRSALAVGTGRGAAGTRTSSTGMLTFLMAAGYTLRELMEYMGHSSLQATERYVKLLPPLDETDPAERLNSYLRRRAVK